VRRFGYISDLAFNIVISTGAPVVSDWSLTPLPAGSVHGAIADAVTGLPVTATVKALATPVEQMASGAYSLTLPSGRTRWRTGLGYRVLTATVTITMGQVITRT
jgi:hypothetical protein